MFSKIFTCSKTIERHQNAPYAEQRARYLQHCLEQGDAKRTVLRKAFHLLWVARRLSSFPSLHLTIEQLRSVAEGRWEDRRRACGHRPLRIRQIRKDFVEVASGWLRFLGCLQTPVQPIPFGCQLEAYCSWARDERGLSELTIASAYDYLKRFLSWYGTCSRPLSQVCVSDIDAYLQEGAQRGWGRIFMRGVVQRLKAFFRYTAEQGWTASSLPKAIQGPRVYAMEGLPKGPRWSEVERLLSTLDSDSPKDIRDRAALMLFAIYGLRVGEVAALRLEHIDWEHDLLHVPRTKRRERQTYPLLPSVGNALIRYLQNVRPKSSCREVFLSLCSPYRPASRSALYHAVASRLKALNVQVAHYGPHCLRHACATQLLADGFSFKEIGDHLGHRSTSATATYAKVDLPHLRAVAAFDLGELS